METSGDDLGCLVGHLDRPYSIILSQNEHTGNEPIVIFCTRVMFLKKHKLTAFDKLLETIKPLVDDCKLLFTKSPLKVVLFPEPVVAAQLALRLLMQC